MSFFSDIIDSSFLHMALLAALLASVACGIVGSYVVARRRSYMVGAISHSLLGGIGLARLCAVRLGWTALTPLAGSLLAGLLASVAVSLLTSRNRMREDTVLSAIWSLGVAAGISFIALTPGYQEDLNSYLFGSILLVSETDLWIMAAMDLFILIAAWMLHNRFLVLCFHEEGLTLRGISVDGVSLWLHVLIGMTVVILSQIVGVVLVLALLVLPAAAAALFARRLGTVMIIATALCFLCSVAGLALSYGPDLPVGATIIELTVVVYLLLAAVKRIRN
jgi:zinc transport system permease protein